MKKRIGLSVVLVVALVFGWHLYLTNEARRIAREAGAKSAGEGELTLSLNPITNVVEMKLVMPPPNIDESNPWANLGQQMGTAFGAGLMKVMEPLAERELNTRARENFDLYAMLVPYRLRVSVDEPDADALERIRAQREEQRKTEETRQREAVSAYITNGLMLENVHVAPGKRFGRPESGVFGTIVNGGDKTLRKVTVRIYFLGADGHRIGEKDYSPVLVTEFGFGDDAPLRPGYRKDFGYSVEDHAPSGWDEQIEAEIVEIDFVADE